VPYAPRLTTNAYAPPGAPRPAAIVIRGYHGSQFNFTTKLYEALTGAGYAWFVREYPGTAPRMISPKPSACVRCPGSLLFIGELVLIGENNGAAIALKRAARTNVAGVGTIGADLREFGGPPALAVTRVLMIHGGQDRIYPAPFCGRLNRL